MKCLKALQKHIKSPGSDHSAQLVEISHLFTKNVSSNNKKNHKKSLMGPLGIRFKNILYLIVL